MGRSIIYVAAAALLAAGCTTTSQRIESAGTPVEPSRTEARGVGEPAPILVVEAEHIRPGDKVRCREGLKKGSNVIITRCMTENAWTRYRQDEAEQARALLRLLQGSGYSGW